MSLPLRRQSHQIIADLLDRVDTRLVAKRLHLSYDTIRRWTRNADNDDELPFEPTGRHNPIDRVGDLLHIMISEGHHRLALETINWLARECGGIFIATDQIDGIKQILHAMETQGQSEEKKK